MPEVAGEFQPFHETTADVRACLALRYAGSLLHRAPLLWLAKITLLFFIFSVGVGLTTPTTALGQEEDAFLAIEDDHRLVSSRYGLTIRRPLGWSVATATDGVVVAFIPEDGTRGTRIAVRLSTDVPEQHRKAYLTAYVEGLKGAYNVLRTPIGQVHGSRAGHEAILAAKSPDGNPSRLVLFVFFRKDVAYSLLLYLAEDEWNELYDVFRGVIQSIAFEEDHE